MKLDEKFFLDGNDEFSNRQKNVFAALDQMSSSQPENRYVQRENEFRERRAVVTSARRETRPLQGQESLFKAEPQPLKRRSPAMNLKSVPDFVKHPTKWKKYDLGDDVMSDKTNQTAAMAFLKEIKERKSAELEGPSTSSSMPPPVKFNRHVKSDGSSKLADKVDPIEKPTFVDGKLTMPEYVVGAEKKKRSPKKQTVVAIGNAVKLGHLEDEENEEDE
uniref:U5 small nuclear ribonucleoprotein TSSC4 n=1 Tax=Lygus hesperus TaxID=30085 RepID=A0A0A9VY75_LYGHE